MDVDPTTLRDEYLAPSEAACRWCPAKAVCPALRAKVEAETGACFEDLTEPEPPTAETPAIELARKMQMAGLIELWVRAVLEHSVVAVRAEVERRLLAGEDVPGFKIVEGRAAPRRWADPERAEAALRAARLRANQMYERKLISPARAEKLAKAGEIGPRKWAEIKALITKPERALSVAPESDRREAYRPATPGDFADFADYTTNED